MTKYAHTPDTCPYCKGNDVHILHGTNVDKDRKTILFMIECIYCARRFIEEYELRFVNRMKEE